MLLIQVYTSKLDANGNRCSYITAKNPQRKMVATLINMNNNFEHSLSNYFGNPKLKRKSCYVVRYPRVPIREFRRDSHGLPYCDGSLESLEKFLEPIDTTKTAN